MREVGPCRRKSFPLTESWLHTYHKDARTLLRHLLSHCLPHQAPVHIRECSIRRASSTSLSLLPGLLVGMPDPFPSLRSSAPRGYPKGWPISLALLPTFVDFDVGYIVSLIISPESCQEPTW